MEKVCRWCLQYHTLREKRDNASTPKFHRSSHKIHCKATWHGRGIPFLDTFPKPMGEGIDVSVYRKPTHMDRYLYFNSSHPILAKRAVVRALMDRACNVGSSPEFLAKEVEYLSKVLCYNNYPDWLIKKWGKPDQSGPLIHLETQNVIKKQFYVSVSYYPGLNESYRKIFKYTHIHVCFKGTNTLKSLLMHPKDKISINQKKVFVYH